MKVLVAIAFALTPTLVRAEDAPIRIWGHPALLGVAERWAAAYLDEHPEASFTFTMHGSDSAIHGLTGGVADIALMGRENDIVDDNGFSRVKEYPATRVEIATGSVSVPGKSDAIAVLVSADNPLRALSLAQLARIIDCGDQSRPIATWGELGLGGAWKNAPVRVHSYDFATRTGAWLQNRVTGKDRRMCWDRITEYSARLRLDGTRATAAEQVGEAARGDRFALAIANAAQAVDGLKVLPLRDGDGPAVFPDAESIAARRYPLTRRVFAFVDRKPGKPLAPHVLDFLRFAISAKGQALLAEDRGYLPLDAITARAQLAVLEDSQ